MTSPFLYLFACSTRNRIVRRVQRLREPRYLVGAIVGAGYLYMMVIRNRMAGRRRTDAIGIPREVLAPLALAGSLVLWLVVLARWIIPVSRQPLVFTGPERDFLLTAPIARRRLVRYKLLRSQAAIFLSSAFMLVFAWRNVPSAWAFLFGMFLLFTTLRLHLLGVALARARLTSGAGRRDPAALIAVAVIGTATAAALWVLVPPAVFLAHAQQWDRALAMVGDRAAHPAARLGLLPFAVMVKPVLSDWPGPFLVAALPAIALAWLNFAWVVRSEGALEESIESIEREAVEGRRAPPRPSYRRPPFSLATAGSAHWAIVWKNLILLGRYASPAVLLRIAAPIVVLALALGTSHRSSLAASLYPVAILLGCGLTLIGPYSFRNDLRQDLARLQVLKTWPITGERLLWGEVLAPFLALSSLIVVLLLVVGALSFAIPPASLGWTDRLAIGVSALLLLPAIVLAQIVIQNAAVVLFPGWVPIGAARPRGVEAIGQGMLIFAGSALLLAIGVLPGAAIGALIGLVAFGPLGWVAIVPGAVLLAFLLAAESALAVHFLGGVLERTEPTAVDAGQ